ncbi:MAG: 50S ribosomal protein L24 [Bacteroidales bacterium]|jgi:large subunit ribosomal protein L24|nr:50S ribosomal protein L24 [Lentimicrobiaceae bacterium]MDG1135883.1 50S ribosomal protein L24 [Bacteroidales bacterium]MDG1902102.1 50S ribosomal protein L24 [Bacteroidales bacterium]MDG2080491.1 50S ribosomal protein L24 [Bacteroidales bacterium]|tara:strand:- start:1432 stop:1752 length:321 start_codon:yes stop_codon:yes gene_type:complete
MAKLHIKKGENVMVIAGNSKGQSGRVLVVDAQTNRAIVEGVNMISKNTKPSADNPKGGIVKQEASVHMSNLMAMDKDGKPVRTSVQVDESTGKKIRISKKSGEAIK